MDRGISRGHPSHMPLFFYMYVEAHRYTNENSTYITLYHHILFDSNIVCDTSAYASGSPETYFFPSVTGSMVQLECHVTCWCTALEVKLHGIGSIWKTYVHYMYKYTAGLNICIALKSWIEKPPKNLNNGSFQVDRFYKNETKSANLQHVAVC